jgi:hypothetical protein
MKLRYPKLASAAPVIMENSRGWRIEMVIKANEDESHSLIAQSGLTNKPAELSKLQGPYQTQDQAVAARAAIADQLINKGFQFLDKVEPMWSLQAQGAIKRLRQQRQDNTGNYSFDPNDVFFD